MERISRVSMTQTHTGETKPGKSVKGDGKCDESSQNGHRHGDEKHDDVGVSQPLFYGQLFFTGTEPVG